MINNVIVVSDLHCGCQYGLCPPHVTLDGGGEYNQSLYQAQVWEWWNEFWDDWVPVVTRGEPYCVVINGDTIDGSHHGSNHQITHNLTDQKNIAFEVLKPIKAKCDGRIYMIRGTEAHVGQSAQEEENLAKLLNAIPDEQGRHSRFELYLKIGNCLSHIMHHIGTTGSMAYETTALMKEFSEACSESARWNIPAPNMVVRSHRHRHSEIRVPTADTYGYCFTTAGWQLKTPFVYKVPGGRLTTPQIGGSLIRQGDEEFYTRHWVKTLPRTKTVEVA